MTFRMLEIQEILKEECLTADCLAIEAQGLKGDSPDVIYNKQRAERRAAKAHKALKEFMNTRQLLKGYAPPKLPDEDFILTSSSAMKNPPKLLWESRAYKDFTVVAKRINATNLWHGKITHKERTFVATEESPEMAMKMAYAKYLAHTELEERRTK